jgi:hypothetical protein
MDHRRKYVTAALVATALGIVMQASTPAMAAAAYPPGPTVRGQDSTVVAFPPGPSVQVSDAAGPGPRRPGDLTHS